MVQGSARAPRGGAGRAAPRAFSRAGTPARAAGTTNRVPASTLRRPRRRTRARRTADSPGRVAPSLTGAAGMRSAWPSSTISATVCSASNGSRLREELVALGPAQHDRDLVLAVLGQAEHRAHVQPVLTRQAVDPDPAVGGPHDTQHRGRPQVGRQAEALHPLRHQHRIRQRRQQRFDLRDVDFPDFPDAAGGRQPQRGQRTQRGVARPRRTRRCGRRPGPVGVADPWR